MPAAYAVVSFFAKLKYCFSKSDRKTVEANLHIAIPEAGNKEISSLVMSIFENFGKYLIDFFWLTKNEKGYMEKAAQLTGTENIDEALSLGKGCIMMGGHFGNWELGAYALANRGYKLNVIALDHLDPRINDFFIKQREKSGIQAMHIGTARTACQKAFSRNELVAILGDRPYGDRGIEVEFFGKTARFPRGAALLSLRNGTPIVMTFCFKENVNKNEHRLIFEKPFLIKREGSLEGQLKDITQRFADRFEWYIRKYSAQWYAFSKIWKD